jgi:hypothetical protein
MHSAEYEPMAPGLIRFEVEWGGVSGARTLPEPSRGRCRRFSAGRRLIPVGGGGYLLPVRTEDRAA